MGLFEVLGFRLNGQGFFIYIRINYGLFLQDCFPFDDLMLRPCSLIDNAYDSNIDWESSCDNSDSDDNSIDHGKSMETIMMTKGLFMVTSITRL